MRMTPAHADKLCIISAFAGCLLLGGCKTGSAPEQRTIRYTQAVKPPDPSADLPYDEYVIDAGKPASMVRPTGTVIDIPASAFVDAEGRTVQGKVTVKVREFHQPEDLYRAGIPMSVDSTRSLFLQSAGMIEILAFSNGGKLELSRDKGAKVSLADFRRPEGHRLYHLAEGGNWQVRDTFSNIGNRGKKERIRMLEEGLAQDSTDGMVFDLIGDERESPQLSAYKGFRWKVRSSLVDEDFKRAMRVDWDSIGIQPIDGSRREYALSFTKKVYTYDSLNQYQVNGPVTWRYRVVATPIRNGSTASRAETAKAMKNLREELERVRREADLLNSFTIDRLGIWNIDRIMKLEDMIWKPVSFDFLKDLGSGYSNLTLYTIFLDDNSVIPYSQGDWGRVGFMKDRRMQLKVVLPGGKTAFVDEKQIAEELMKGSSVLNFDAKHLQTPNRDAGF